MSRFSYTNDDGVDFVTGHDHVTGVFVQIYSPKFLEKESDMVNINNQGVQIDPLATLLVTANQKKGLREIQKRFDSAIKSGISHPNLDMDAILKVADLFGFSEQKDQIRYDMS